MLEKQYEVEWTYFNENTSYYYTEHRNFANAKDQQEFALEKINNSSTCEVRVITIEIWRNEL